MNLRDLALAEYRFMLAGMDLVTVFFFLNVAFAGGIVTAVATRFTYPSVSWEGRAIWLVKTAPVPDGALLGSKFVMSAVPLFVLAVGVLFAATQTMDVPRFMRVMAYVTMGSFAIGLSSLGVGIGALYPRLRARNASEAAASPGGLAFMVLGYFFILATVVVEAEVVRANMASGSLPFEWAGRYLGGGIATLVLLHATFWFLPWVVGVRAFRRLED